MSWVALAVALGGVVTYAVQADGYQSHRADLNDGGIWVSSNRDGSYGRINKPIGELDGTIFSQPHPTLDVVQDGSSVVGVDLGEGVVVPLDPAQMTASDDEASIPGTPAVGMAGGSLAVLDTASGELWATREDPAVGLPTVSVLSHQADPLATVGKDAALAVALDGTVYAVSSVEDRLLTLRQDQGSSFATPTTQDLPGARLTDAIGVTAVGAVPVVLDSASGRLVVIGGAETEVPPGSVLQQPGPSADTVLVGARDALLSVDLTTGAVSTVAADVAGDPANPVRLGDCAYGAWAGGTGAVLTACGDGTPVPQSLAAQTSDLVFRTNRGEVVLNDRATGNVWNVDSDKPTRLDNWDAFHRKAKNEDDNNDDQRTDQGDRRPPRARDDRLGARPGRTTILHPLDNDVAPSGRLLAIRSVRNVGGSDATLAISPDGQTVQITLPGDAVGATSFQYFIDDGRQSVSDHATVRVPIVAARQANDEPVLRKGYQPRVWTVPATGTIDVPVLSDWRDPKDGDPVSSVSAKQATGPDDGADARITAAGAVRFQAPTQGGAVTVDYQVTDGLGPPVTESLHFRVQDPGDFDTVAPVAEPDVIAGETGKPILISPLANDLPGADPLTPDATLELAGRVGNVPGAQVTTDLVNGTVTLHSDTAQTYFLDYQAVYGSADTSTGRIRIDVRAPENPPLDPVAVPDSVTLFGQAASLVDVLANDVDPSGGLLSVQRADPLAANQLDVAVVNGRWLQIAARQGALQPNPQIVRYTISNGLRSGIQGQVVVSQRAAPADTTPVTQNDVVTVRSGTSQAIPVLDNDFSPSGGTLTLVSEGQGKRAGSLDVQPVDAPGSPPGEAFVSGRTVRYVAPADLGTTRRFTIRYQVANEQGETATGKARVTVLPVRLRDNEPPEPPVLEGRTVSGDTVKLRLPGYGVDPDGDAVTIIGLDSAPTLGSVGRIGANSIDYTAYPGSVGTEEFSYRITDTLGATSVGTVRVSVAPPGPPQPPLAVPDAMTVAPGRAAVVDVLANDLVAAGSRVTLTLVDPPAGVSLRSETGPVQVTAQVTRGLEAGRSVEIPYRITDGLETSQATLTLRTLPGYNNPPIVSDAFGAAGDGRNVTVDVLSAGTEAAGSTAGAYDPDGPVEDLRVSDVYAPRGIATRVSGGRITVERAEQPMVVAFRVQDADGGAATGSLYVPAARSGLPFVRPDALIRLDPGETKRLDLASYVVNPSGAPVSFTLKSRIWASPGTKLDAVVVGRTFRVRAARNYAGPGAVVFEVTTAGGGSQPRRAILSVPVQVGATRPILRCPDDPIQVPQAESVRIDLGAVCHVWTDDPARVPGLTWETSLDPDSDPSLSAGTPDAAGVVTVSASGAAAPGAPGTLRVVADNSAPGRINVRVVDTPPPSLAPIRVSTLKAGESQTIDLARYLQPGVRNPRPTVIEAAQLTRLPVQISSSGSSVTISAGALAHGHAEFRVVMSDVAGRSGPGRRVEGRIALDVLGVPDAPGVPVPGNRVLDSAVSLDWRVPASNGSPIDSYEVQDQSGHPHRCGSASCDIRGLSNGRSYRFRVRAHNAVGFSPWSAFSTAAMPDNPPNIQGRVHLVEAGDRYLKIAWKPLEVKNGGTANYRVSWLGGQMTAYSAEATIPDLDNHVRYRFTVVPINAFSAGAITSELLQPVGTPPTPPPPRLTDQETPGSLGAVTLSWDPVDPNGPGPTRYTVYRNDVPLKNCRLTTAHGCDDTSLQYNGSTYAYRLEATNKGGRSSPIGPPTTWHAVGQPAAWGSWDIAATGDNNRAKATFIVPPVRGGDSTVRVYVDGTKVDQLPGKDLTGTTVVVPNNLTPHSVMLEACNEGGSCSQSSSQLVQTWGPLAPQHIQAITPDVNATQVSWTIRVDSNGNPATVSVTSDHRSETFQVPVGVTTVTTSSIDLGYSGTEAVTVTLADAAPDRGAVTGTGSATTDPAPPPTVVASRGAACNDDPSKGLQPCDTGLFAGPKCTDASCAFVHIGLSNWRTDVAGTAVFCSVNGADGRPYPANVSTDTPDYYGSPGNAVTVYCENALGQSAQTEFVW